MEHRCTERMPKAIKVILYRDGMPVATCKTRDIGFEGIFVESGPLMYRSNTPLEVLFETTTNNSNHMYRLAAVVAHSSTKGLGLYFHDSHSDAFEAWRNVVQNDDSATPRRFKTNVN